MSKKINGFGPPGPRSRIPVDAAAPRSKNAAMQCTPSVRVALLASAVFAATACPEGPTRYEAIHLGDVVTLICPGDPSGLCDFGGDTELLVGASARTINPQGWEAWDDVDGNSEFRSGVDEFHDCGMDRLCPEDDGYPGPDPGEGNDTFDAIWLAGFQNSRAMQGIHDDLWARATVLTQGETTIGVVALDVVGFFHNEVEEVRRTARTELGLDTVMVVSTHTHEGPDTMGIWGRNIARSGVNPEHMGWIHTRIQEALADAQATAVPVDVYAGAFTIPDDYWAGSGVNNVNIDTRDPAITDATIWTARFEAKATGETVGTWINFPNHPEATGDRNTLVSSDFADTLRTTVEEGAATGPDGALPGVGGVASYLQGAVGGMMTPLRCDTIDLDGTVFAENNLEKAGAVGRVLGYHALQAIGGEVLQPDAALSLRIRELFAPVQNQGYHYMFQLGVFDRVGYNYDPDSLIDEWNTPDVKTEVDFLRIGDLSVATLPGELLPELAIGGYDGSHTGPLQVIVDPDNPNPPDLSAAPDGPYLKDILPGEYKMVFGLANDELGYIIPDYNYKLDDGSPYLDEAEGDHYEETNSLGIDATSRFIPALEALIRWTPPQD